MPNEQRIAIKKCEFGSFIEMKEMTVKGKLVDYLIDNFDAQTRSLRLMVFNM